MNKLFSFRYKLSSIAWKKWQEKDLEFPPQKVQSPVRVCSPVSTGTPMALDREHVDSSICYEIIHTPMRCSKRKCIACCRKKFQPRASTSTSMSRSSLADSYVISSIDRSLISSCSRPMRDVSPVPVSPFSSSFPQNANSEFKNWQKSSVKDKIDSTGVKILKSHDPFSRFARDITILKSTFPDRSIYGVENENRNDTETDIDNTEAANDNQNKIVTDIDRNSHISNMNIHENILTEKFQSQSPIANLIGLPSSEMESNSVDFKIAVEDKINSITAARASRMEENFLKRLGMVQKLERDFIIKKFTYRRKK